MQAESLRTTSSVVLCFSSALATSASQFSPLRFLARVALRVEQVGCRDAVDAVLPASLVGPALPSKVLAPAHFLFLW